MARWDDGRAAAWIVAIGIVLLVVSPALCPAAEDGFPLSTYPMFARRRDAAITIDHAVGIGLAGEVSIPPRFLGTNEVMQARVWLRRAIEVGPAGAAETCRAIAGRVSRDNAEPWSGIHSVELRTSTVDAVAFLRGAAEPRTVRRHARCPVRR